METKPNRTNQQTEIIGSGTKREVGVDLLTTSPNSQLRDFLYQVPVTLGYGWFEFAVHKAKVVVAEDVACDTDIFENNMH